MTPKDGRKTPELERLSEAEIKGLIELACVFRRCRPGIPEEVGHDSGGFRTTWCSERSDAGSAK